MFQPLGVILRLIKFELLGNYFRSILYDSNFISLKMTPRG